MIDIICLLKPQLGNKLFDRYKRYNILLCAVEIKLLFMLVAIFSNIVPLLRFQF